MSAAALVALPASHAHAFAPPPLNPDEGVTAPEDLMKEHGVLNRCLLVYEEGLRRLVVKHETPGSVFHRTADLVRLFVEEYHERNEEKYIFPVFEQHGKFVELVTTLKAQHIAGRRVTAKILELSKNDVFKKPENQEQVIALVQSFIRMYRPHESREDTVLFPALRTILTAKEVAALGDRMEEDEHKVLGDEGFEKAVQEITWVEQSLGIYDLQQFTPKE